MGAELARVEGIEETCDALTRLPGLMVAHCFQKALRSAAEVIVAEIQARTPIGDDIWNFDEPKLRDSLVTEITLDSEFRGGIAEIGFGKVGYRALWVEYGHEMVGHRPDKKKLGFVDAHPFIRPAFDACENRAIDAFVDTFVQEMEAVKTELGLGGPPNG